MDGTFFVLRSDARLFSVNGQGRDVNMHTLNLPFVNNEGLFFYAEDNVLMVASKSRMIDEGNMNDRYFHLFKMGGSGYSGKTILLEFADIEEKLPEAFKKMKFNPSALAVHPLTRDVYILSAKSGMLVVSDMQGRISSVYVLHPDIFFQPEGIAFFTDGDMLISNEGNRKTGSPGNILIFTYKE